MTEKRFTYMIDRVFDLWEVYDNKEKVICLVRNTDAKDLCDLLNEQHEQINTLRESRRELISANNEYRMRETELAQELSTLVDENEQLKQNLRMVEKRADKVYEENGQLKKDATTLIYANQDYRQQNQNLQKQLDYIQNSINNAIKHQKTELGQKALQEIIADYNEWMLGHNGVKE